MRRGDCIYQRKDGRWEARYIKGYDEVTGKAVYRAVYGASREEAETKRAQILDLYPTPSKDNIEDYHPELNLLILGAGSHGKNVYEIAEQLGVLGKQSIKLGSHALPKFLLYQHLIHGFSVATI